MQGLRRIRSRSCGTCASLACELDISRLPLQQKGKGEKIVDSFLHHQVMCMELFYYMKWLGSTWFDLAWQLNVAGNCFCTPTELCI